jgi:hypothetical protein
MDLRRSVIDEAVAVECVEDGLPLDRIARAWRGR